MYPPAIRHPLAWVMKWGTSAAAALFFTQVNACASPASAVALLRCARINSAAAWAAIAPFRALRDRYLAITRCTEANNNPPPACA